MATLFALRATLVASLGLGAADLMWIGTSIAPRLLDRGPVPVAAARVEPPVAAEPAIAPAPAPASARAPAPAIASGPAAESPDDRVYFGTSSALLGPVTRATLKRVAERARTGATIALEGHADYRGDEKMNHNLSKQRAFAVGAYLLRLGVPRAQLRISYIGAGAPASDGELWRDRRVGIQIIGGSR